MIFLFFVMMAANEWYGYNKSDIVINAYTGFVIIPKIKSPHWIWRTEFFDHEPQVDLRLLEYGFHLAYIDIQNMYGSPSALDIMDQFYEHVMTMFNLSTKVVLEGFSRGGLYAFRWAIRHPSRVAVLYGDAPVLDFKSWPAGLGHGQRSENDWQQLLHVYKLTETEALTYPFNPVDQLAILALHKIPIICVCGQDDTVVPFDENTGLAEKRYKILGGPIKVIIKQGCNHHPHSLDNPTMIVDFIMNVTMNKTVNYHNEFIFYCTHFYIIYFIVIVSLVFIPLCVYYYKKPWMINQNII
jgi:pimeloyl-ACP methyl ester carboxylesterase